MKAQIVICQNTQQIICTDYAKGKDHDMNIFKNSRIVVLTNIIKDFDLGYKGVQKMMSNVNLPFKKSKNHKLTKEEKSYNKSLSSKRVVVENILARIKIFKVVCDRYRNRRKRFGLRFNLICGICNMERIIYATKISKN
jgi:hypothetical protein